MAKLNAAARKAIPTSSFAIPSRADTSQEKAKSGNYPINDLGHARAALSRVSQHGTSSEKAQVRAAVHRKYPNIGLAGAAKKKGLV